jgi:DNA-directed RNA polymerase subunit M/transcription elongation factor TFIIS
LIVDEKSPKLYFLPNLDNVDFDEVAISESENKASGILLASKSQSAQTQTGSKLHTLDTTMVLTGEPNEPKPTMQRVAHCPHCGNPEMSFLAEQRYKCKPCGKKISLSKVVFK